MYICGCCRYYISAMLDDVRFVPTEWYIYRRQECHVWETSKCDIRKTRPFPVYLVINKYTVTSFDNLRTINIGAI